MENTGNQKEWRIGGVGVTSGGRRLQERVGWGGLGGGGGPGGGGRGMGSIWCKYRETKGGKNGYVFVVGDIGMTHRDV